MPGSFPEPIPEPVPLTPIKSNDTIQSKPAKQRKSRIASVWSFLTRATYDFRHPPTTSRGQYVGALGPGLAAIHRDRLRPAILPATRNETENAITRLAIGVGGSGPSDPFTTAVKGIRAESSVFSTSYSVRFDPPETLIRLAKTEFDDTDSMSSSQNNGTASTSLYPPELRMTNSTASGTTASNPMGRKRRRVTGADKAALSSILGWRPDGTGAGFGGVSSFLKHQCITVLYSSPAQTTEAINSKLAGNTRPTSPYPSGTSSTAAANGTATLAAVNAHVHGITPPRLAQWKTYRYYDEKEPTLGQWITEASDEADIAAHQNPIHDTAAPIEHTWMHLNWKLTAKLEHQYSMNSDSLQVEMEGALEQDFDDEITVHVSCSVCGKETKKRNLTPGAW